MSNNITGRSSPPSGTASSGSAGKAPTSATSSGHHMISRSCGGSCHTSATASELSIASEKAGSGLEYSTSRGILGDGRSNSGANTPTAPSAGASSGGNAVSGGGASVSDSASVFIVQVRDEARWPTSSAPWANKGSLEVSALGNTKYHAEFEGDQEAYMLAPSYGRPRELNRTTLKLMLRNMLDTEGTRMMNAP